MEENKNRGNVLTIILFVLLLVAVGVIGYLLGSNSDKENVDNNNNNLSSTEEKENTITPVSYSPKCSKNVEDNLQVDIDENKYNNVIDYIKDQDNVKISLWYCSNSEDIESMNYTLSEIEKDKALNELLNSNHYMEDLETGGGACVPTITISYTRNDKQYFVKYWGKIIESCNDGNIYKIIDKSVTNNFTQEYCMYQISTLGTTINDIIKYER